MKISTLALVCLSLVSGTALANPIMIVGRLSAEATGSTHVRIRYYSNYGTATPQVATYGTSHSDWFTTGESYTADTGSGVKSMTYYFMCDCHVPTGSALTYTAEGATTYIPAANLTATITPVPSSSTLCDLQCASADSRDGGVDSTPDSLLSPDVSLSRDLLSDRAPDTSVAIDVPVTPEDKPDAPLAADTSVVVSTGGSTATSSAAGGSVAPGGATATSAATATGGNAGTSSAPLAGGNSSATTVSTSAPSEEKKGGGSCSFSSHGRTGALSLLLALGLMALSWRRRR